MSRARLHSAQFITGRAIFLLFLVLCQRANAAEVLQEISEHVYPLDSGGAISIHAIDGSVLLYAGEREDVSIKTIKKAYSQDRFKNIQIDVKATPKEVALETIIAPGKTRFGLTDRSGTVDCVIIVPQTSRVTKLEMANGEVLIAGLRGGTVTAHLVNGFMTVYDCFGNLDLTTENGRLEVVYNWSEDNKFSLRLCNSQGLIRTRFPSDASVSVKARTQTGAIVNALAGQSNLSEPVRSLEFTTAADPVTTCEIRSTNGNIRIEQTY